jgi:hypothetical protein
MELEWGLNQEFMDPCKMNKIKDKPQKLGFALKIHNCKIHNTPFVQNKCPYCQHVLMNDDWE